MRARKAVVALVVVALVSFGLGSSAAGAIDDPVVAVTPATDLVDGSLIHVAVTGAQPLAELFAGVCAGDHTTEAECFGSFSRGFTVGESGTVEFDLGLEAVWPENGLPGNPEIDCRVAPGCVLRVMTQRTDGSIATVFTPLEFRPDGPLRPPPTLMVTPSADVVDGQQVVVTGSGFIPLSGLALSQCRTPFRSFGDCQQPRDFVSIGSDGTFTSELDLASIVFVGLAQEEIDCREVACALVGTRGEFQPDPRRAAAADLGFRPGGPLLPPPALTVTPDEGLVDGQVVEVTGTGFRPGDVIVSQCAVGTGHAFARCGTERFVPVGSDGALHTDVTVRVLARGETGGVDCRTPPGCSIAVMELGGLGRVVTEAPVAFDPAGPGPTAPTLTVAPAGPLPGRSPVLALGEGYPPSTEVYFAQCAYADGRPTECSGSGDDFVRTDPSGRLVAGTIVRPVIEGPDGSEHDCRSEPCALVAQTFDGLPGVAPLSFTRAEGARGRYLSEVFDEVDVTSGVVYRHTTNGRGAPVDLALDVYRPRGDTRTKRPAIMFMFGGYFGSGSKEQLSDLARAMARRGYVSIAIDYRTRPWIFEPGNGCVPVGGTCLDPTQLGPAIVDARDDARAAMVWIHEHATEYGIEPRAISAAGWSAGAITALNLAHDHTDAPPARSVPAAAISLAGILTVVPEAGNPPTLMLGGNRDSLLALDAQIAGCGLISSVGGRCRFVAYAGHRPAADADACVRFDVSCTYVVGRNAAHGWFFEDRPDVVDRISTFLARTVLAPAGLLPGHHRPDARDRHHHRHHRHDDRDGRHDHHDHRRHDDRDSRQDHHGHRRHDDRDGRHGDRDGRHDDHGRDRHRHPRDDGDDRRGGSGRR